MRDWKHDRLSSRIMFCIHANNRSVSRPQVTRPPTILRRHSRSVSWAHVTNRCFSKPASCNPYCRFTHISIIPSPFGSNSDHFTDTLAPPDLEQPVSEILLRLATQALANQSQDCAGTQAAPRQIAAKSQRRQQDYLFKGCSNYSSSRYRDRRQPAEDPGT
jgi:hypothetical protein